MTAFDEPVVVWRGATDTDTALVVLLQGRGSNEADIVALADHLPDGLRMPRSGLRSARAAGSPGSPTAASAAPSPSP